MKVSYARLTAYDVLRDVEDRDAYANLALPARIRDAKLTGADTAFVTELVSGTLRQQGYYDAILEIAANRDIAEIDARTRRVLRLGAHQMLNMRVPAHAALNESVELQRKVASAGGAGFVNGVLRAILREEDWEARLREKLQGDNLLAVLYSHPVWIVRAMRDALRVSGRENELVELLSADNLPPKVNLAVFRDTDGGFTAAEITQLQEQGIEITDTGVSPIGAELARGNPADLQNNLPDGVKTRVQDQGSQLAALALIAAQDIKPGEQWLDLCAGPGGKTAVLAHAAEKHQATLTANEVAPHRAKLVENALAEIGAKAEVRCADGTSDAAFGNTKYDRILVDAPCSGLGALRRRPEARWRKQPSDLPELVALQAKLIRKAYEHLNPGGIIAYVTCSPHLAETKLIADRFTQETGAIPLKTPEILQKIAKQNLNLPDQPYAQLWPHSHNTDAMFIALLQKPA